MKYFFMALGLSLGLSALVNHLTDPVAVFSRLLELAPQGAILRVPEGPPLGTRQLQCARASRGPRPGLLVLGSSDAMPFSADLFRRSLTLKNLWVPGCDTEDMVAQWQSCKEAGLIPARVLILLERYAFNAAGKDYLSWDQMGAVARFENQAGGALGLWARGRAWLESSFSYRGLRVAADAWGLIADRHDSPEWVAKTRLKDYDFYFDGSGLDRVYPGRKDQARLEICSYRRFLENYAFSAGRLDRLKALLRDMASHGCGVMLLLPPLHPAARRALEKGIMLTRIENDLVAALEGAQREGLIALLDTHETFESLGLAESDFEDGNHFKQASASRLLRAATQSSPEWRSLLPEPGP